MAEQLFRREYHEYKRDLDYVSQWVDQSVTYALLEEHNLNVSEYKSWLRENIKPEGLFPMTNPRMLMIRKDENNDRRQYRTTMLDYLRQVHSMDLRFAPTFTTYRPEYKQKALESCFLVQGMNARKKAKKLKFEAIQEGNEILADYYQNLQLMQKILNNSSSGAHATKGNILYNQTGHSTLTSICRSTTSFANSTNEKFLGGRRHYYNAEVTINNIISTLTYIDLNEAEAVINEFQLKWISQDDLLFIIKRSTDLYWRSEIEFGKIESVVRKLSTLQCTAYAYISDMWVLRYYNEEFVKNWLNHLILLDTIQPIPEDEAKQYIDAMDSDLAALIAIYCASICDGRDIFKTIKESTPEQVCYIGAVIKNTILHFEKYRRFIKMFWVSDIMPFSTAHVPTMMRGVVLGSDTDSSLFSIDEWVKWYRGQVIEDQLSDNLVCTMVYIVSQHIAHILGMMTGFLNIQVEKRNLIAMKNEFYFSTFITTSLGKHYVAKAKAQEGIVFKPGKEHIEIKGVGLKHSKVPASITEQLHDTLKEYMKIGASGQPFSIKDYFRFLGELEFQVYNSIKNGEPYYLQSGQVKVKEAYKSENSLYRKSYEMWEAVFADKYGYTQEPPYDTYKVDIVPNTRARMDAWVASWEDRDLANRFMNWIETVNNGKVMKTFHIPQLIAQSTGIPTELFTAIDIRKLVYTVVAPYYIFIESMGIFMRDPKAYTRLCSDDFPEWCIPATLFDIDDDEDEDDIDLDTD